MAGKQFLIKVATRLQIPCLVKTFVEIALSRSLSERNAFLCFQR